MHASRDNSRNRTCIRGGKSVTDGTVVWRVKDSRCPYSLGQFVAKMGEPKEYEYLLLCDGSTISAENYPELCAVLGGTQLPNLVGRVLQGDSVGGEYKEAGLPNITGSITPYTLTSADVFVAFNSFSDDNGAIYGDEYSHYASKSAASIISQQYNKTLKFDASRSSTCYGKCNTVQPPAYTTRIYICYAG